MSGRMSLAVLSLVLAGGALILSVLGAVDFVLRHTHRHGSVWALSLFLAGVVGIGALVAGWLVLAGARRSGDARVVRTMASAGMWAGCVFGLLAWLAMFALPNFLQASTRAPQARAKSEMRQMSVALETYYIDHNIYPPAIDENGRFIPYDPVGSAVSAGYVPRALTTPIAYLDEIFMDPFHLRRDGSEGPYRYATNGTSCWIMTSRGRDLDDDIPIEQYPVPDIGGCSFKQFMSQFGGPAIEYDATNGTASSGDILRVGP